MTTLHIPDATPIHQVVAFAESIGAKLRRRSDGSYTLEPKAPPATQPPDPWGPGDLQAPERHLHLARRGGGAA